jgi:hypothetical protein
MEIDRDCLVSERVRWSHYGRRPAERAAPRSTRRAILARTATRASSPSWTSVRQRPAPHPPPYCCPYPCPYCTLPLLTTAKLLPPAPPAPTPLVEVGSAVLAGRAPFPAARSPCCAPGALFALTFRARAFVRGAQVPARRARRQKVCARDRARRLTLVTFEPFPPKPQSRPRARMRPERRPHPPPAGPSRRRFLGRTRSPTPPRAPCVC